MKKLKIFITAFALIALPAVPVLANDEAAKDSSAAMQQGSTVTGVVKDAAGLPVIGASVIIKGTDKGTVTDLDGKFSIAAPANATLEISCIGYVTAQTKVGGAKELSIILEEDSKMLDEIVVIGYGTRSKRDVTTAVSNISSETISKSIAMSAENAMQGTMSGVQVSGNSGNPMSRPTIRIRGTNTWGVSDPLYVVDGVAITEMGAGIEREDARIKDVRGPLNIMTMIDPNDIESISVLKDASAAAIYGVRAANGVVLITTKKGRVERTSVDFNARVGFQNLTQELDWLTTPEYTKFVQGVFASDPERNPSEDNVGRFDPTSPRYLGNSPTYNWQDEVRNKNAASQDYSVSVSGGTQNTDYHITLGYTDNEGVLMNNELQRYSGAIKFNTKINDWIKAGLNYRLVNAKGRDVGTSYFDLSRPAPWQPIYSDGSIPGYNGYAYAVGGILPDGTYSAEKLYGQGTRINDLGRANTNDQHYDSWRNLGTMYLELTPIKHLTIKGTVSMDRYQTTKYTFEDIDSNPFDYTSGDPRTLGGGKSVGKYEERDTFNNNMTTEIMANYANSFGKHNLDVLFNFSDQHYDAKYRISSTEYLTTKKDYLMNLGGERTYNNAEADRLRWALQGYLFRVGYNYAYKYYLDVTVRRDGSARFAPEHRWGTFPSVSAAWRLTNEPFMANVNWINDLKLRAGWGQLGNQEVRDMAYLSTIAANPRYAFGNVDHPDRPGSGVVYEGATVYGISNRDLSWEKTSTFNIGFDSELFGGLTFSSEYYHKITHGILQEIDLPPSVGVVEAPVSNVAKVLNHGFEFNINWNGKAGDFVYSIGGNLTTTRNRVLETYNHIPTSGGTVEEGYSMFYHKAYVVDGIFQSDAEAQEWMSKYSDSNYQNAKVGAGDFYFKDLRGAPKKEGEFYSEGPDGKIDSYDMVPIGKSIPGFFYGLNFNAEYKGFDFSMQFTGVGDVMKYNGIKAGTFMATEGDNVTHIVDKAWTPSNAQNEYPRLVFGDPANNMRSSSFFYESAAYFRLQNIQLGYTLPATVYKACNNFVRNIRFYLGASNLFTITPYTGFDPESDAYPTPRTVFMGVNLKF